MHFMHLDNQNKCLKNKWLFHDFGHFLTNSMSIPGLENKNHFPWLFQAAGTLSVLNVCVNPWSKKTYHCTGWGYMKHDWNLQWWFSVAFITLLMSHTYLKWSSKIMKQLSFVSFQQFQLDMLKETSKLVYRWNKTSLNGCQLKSYFASNNPSSLITLYNSTKNTAWFSNQTIPKCITLTVFVVPRLFSPWPSFGSWGGCPEGPGSFCCLSVGCFGLGCCWTESKNRMQRYKKSIHNLQLIVRQLGQKRKRKTKKGLSQELLPKKLSAILFFFFFKENEHCETLEFFFIVLLAHFSFLFFFAALQPIFSLFSWQQKKKKKKAKNWAPRVGLCGKSEFTYLCAWVLGPTCNSFIFI